MDTIKYVSKETFDAMVAILDSRRAVLEQSKQSHLTLEQKVNLQRQAKELFELARAMQD